MSDSCCEYASPINTLAELAGLANYSLLDSLTCDPDATDDGVDYAPRQVFSGHYVPLAPTPLENPVYVAHSTGLFRQLGLADELAQHADFGRLFSGDLSALPAPMRKLGWACGYALSIMGTEYTQQCPFRTGNGYGDGRAVSVLELVANGQRWEMQLKGGGRTPYCRGGDGRAVLRSSVREFLAQEHMHALGVPTSRSLCLFASQSEQVQRPWYSSGSHADNPDSMMAEPVAITTRVASSFLRVGQLELFGRRARTQAHPQALAELETLVEHVIAREYSAEIDCAASLADRAVALAECFRTRLIALVVNWLRVGYCQGNFNSDNCALGGFTLDYGPYGFCELFSPQYQPWTGGGQHYSFYSQGIAAQQNFAMLCAALRPITAQNTEADAALDDLQRGFGAAFDAARQQMWAEKLGLESFDAGLFKTLEGLMLDTAVDYTLFFRELSSIPDDIEALKKSFYRSRRYADDTQAIDARWAQWLQEWHGAISAQPKALLAQRMKSVNPKYSLREWQVVPAYQRAMEGDYSLVHELQAVMAKPYDEQSSEIEAKYYRLKPYEYFGVGGVSHYSCSS
ncbi:MAG: protein adenylyltransferase SelO [Pseudomonadales bacterium]